MLESCCNGSRLQISFVLVSTVDVSYRVTIVNAKEFLPACANDITLHMTFRECSKKLIEYAFYDNRKSYFRSYVRKVDRT